MLINLNRETNKPDPICGQHLLVHSLRHHIFKRGAEQPFLIRSIAWLQLFGSLLSILKSVTDPSSSASRLGSSELVTSELFLKKMTYLYAHNK
jgi:hypothetical protein